MSIELLSHWTYLDFGFLVVSFSTNNDVRKNQEQIFPWQKLHILLSKIQKKIKSFKSFLQTAEPRNEKWAMFTNKRPIKVKKTIRIQSATVNILRQDNILAYFNSLPRIMPLVWLTRYSDCGERVDKFQFLCLNWLILCWMVTTCNKSVLGHV